MKVIFLDIDGVLNRDPTKERFKNFVGIDVFLATKLQRWLETHPQYSVVLSSTWRLEEDFKQEVKRYINFIDITPDCRYQGLKRGFEIEFWLERNKTEGYVILDDYGPEMFLAQQRPYLVQTSPVHGLRDKNLKKIEELLGD